MLAEWLAFVGSYAAEIVGIDQDDNVFDQVLVDTLSDLRRKMVEEGEPALPCSCHMSGNPESSIEVDGSRWSWCICWIWSIVNSGCRAGGEG